MMNEIVLIGDVDFYDNCNSGVLKVKRLSGVEDKVSFVLDDEFKGKELPPKVAVIGEVHTRNIEDATGRHKAMYVKVNNYMHVTPDSEYCNQVTMEAFIAHKKRIRVTPKGKVIIDAVLAYNDGDGQSYYPQIIAWGRMAHIIDALPLGTRVYVKGRYQSRAYTKPTDPEGVERIAYEISISEVKPL